MARIEFKTKIKKLWVSDTEHVPYVDIPTLTRAHCDMSAFRQHLKYGPYANSDLFPGILRRIRSEVFGEGREWVRLSDLPACVTLDDSKFLAVVSFEV